MAWSMSIRNQTAAFKTRNATHLQTIDLIVYPYENCTNMNTFVHPGTTAGSEKA